MEYIIVIAITLLTLCFVLMLWALCAVVRINNQIKELEKELEQDERGD